MNDDMCVKIITRAIWMIEVNFQIVVVFVDTWKSQMCKIGRELGLVVEEDVNDVVEVGIFAQVQ